MQLVAANCQPTGEVQVGRQTPTDIVSCLATRAWGRSLSSRRWTTRRLGDGAVAGIGRIVRATEHPLAHGVCSQLLRILYLAELNGIDGHAVTEAEESGRVNDDDIKGHLCI